MFDADLHHAIDDLVARGDLGVDSEGYAIAQRLIHLGYDSLSAAQWAVYDEQVVPSLNQRQFELERSGRI